MFGSADVKLSVTGLLLVLGVLANVFNLLVMLVQQWRSRGIHTVAIIICIISVGNILQQTSTFILVASVWGGVLCWIDSPLFYRVVLFVWLSSSSVSFWSVAWLSVFYCVRVLSFSSAVLRAIKENISTILNVTLVASWLFSCVMFTPFFYLQPHDINRTEKDGCIIRKPLFPAWVNVNVYVIIFICYLTLLPLMFMLPTSVGLVVYLCKQALSVQRNQSSSHAAHSYVLICKLTVALVGVYLITLLTISLYYFHAIFASGLSADMLFLSLSFYCITSAILLTCSNKHLREKLKGLFCEERRWSTLGKNRTEDKSKVTETV
ncbi:taste receptor, type 2, member 200, tandem duplicate 1 [Genypterus blacodes]|uniref:taste receptor, type 2, member 200, tandem duplicate 1 n=1 Tax=Genypterus blacodes TaxID=154954 RepID=UPI003F774578